MKVLLPVSAIKAMSFVVARMMDGMCCQVKCMYINVGNYPCFLCYSVFFFYLGRHHNFHVSSYSLIIKLHRMKLLSAKPFLLFILLFNSLPASAQDRWAIQEDGSIRWEVKDRLPHT